MILETVNVNQMDNKKDKIQRPGDLAPKGVRSTIKSNYTFNETFDHIFKTVRKYESKL